MTDTFPSLNYQYPLIVIPRWNTLLNSFDSGIEERRQKWVFPVFDVTIPLKGLSLTDSQTMFNFFMGKKGRFTPFYFFDPFIYLHTGVFICTTDGINDTFDIPTKGVSSYTFYDDGVALTETVDYTILADGGGGDSARIEFTSVPATGSIITGTFYGYRRFYVRFDQDSLERIAFTVNRTEYQIKLIGVKEVGS